MADTPLVDFEPTIDDISLCFGNMATLIKGGSGKVIAYEPIKPSAYANYIKNSGFPSIKFRDGTLADVVNIDIENVKFEFDNEDVEMLEKKLFASKSHKVELIEKNKQRLYALLERLRSKYSEKGDIYFPPVLEEDILTGYLKLPKYKVEVTFNNTEDYNDYWGCLRICWFTSINPYKNGLEKTIKDFAKNINFQKEAFIKDFAPRY